MSVFVAENPQSYGMRFVRKTDFNSRGSAKSRGCHLCSRLRIFMTRVCCRRLIALVLVVHLSTSAVSFAGLTPEQIALVVNGDSVASLTVANEYLALRGIPSANVITLSKLSSIEQMPVDKFRDEILDPVLKAIDDRGLTAQIECIAYSADLPTAIHVGSDVGTLKLPQILTPVASINGLTFLHQLTLKKDIRYLDLNANHYARRVVSISADTQWNPGELQTYAKVLQCLEQESVRRRGSRSDDQAADALHPINNSGLFDAAESLTSLKQAHPQSADLLYNLACVLAALDRSPDALATLKEAVRAGWWDHRHAMRDPDWRALRDHSEFRSILDEMKQVAFDVEPSKAFRADIDWRRSRTENPSDQPPRYLLSTTLAVTAGRGNSLADTLAALRRSVTADGTRPTGTVYFLRNGDIRSTTREWAFEAAVRKLKSLGVNAVIEDGVLPRQKQDVAGAVIGIADFDWPKCGSSMRPGAIVEHLTSFGGVMTKGAGQTPLTEFLRHGAAGSSGTVTEPYALQAKFPSPFLHVHYASGCTLAEAFYQSVTGPYQLLVVGDPLCCPWRKPLAVSIEGLSEDRPVRGTISVTPKVILPDGLVAGEVQLCVDGHRVKADIEQSRFSLDTTRFADGSHELTIVARATDEVETTGRGLRRFVIQNHSVERALRMVSHAEPDHPFEKPFQIEATCPGAASISIHHLDRVIARIEAETGSMSLDPERLGAGRIELVAVASYPDGTTLRSQPVRCSVRLP